MRSFCKLMVFVLPAALCSLPGVAQAQLLGLDLDVDIGSEGISASVGSPNQNNGPGGGSSDTSTTSSSVPVILDQQSAVDAVNGGRAVPLATVIASVREQQDASVIDAHLISVSGFLLYELKLLDPQGEVSEIYYYARTGQIVLTD